MSNIETIAADVIDASFKLHRDVGPGLLESVYEMVLAAKLTRLGYSVLRQAPVTVTVDDLVFEGAFRADLIVNDLIMVEIKSVERLSGVHAKQLLTYLRLTGRPLGLLVNFGGETLKDGLKRVVNAYKPVAPSCLRVNQEDMRR